MIGPMMSAKTNTVKLKPIKIFFQKGYYFPSLWFMYVLLEHLARYKSACT